MPFGWRRPISALATYLPRSTSSSSAGDRHRDSLTRRYARQAPPALRDGKRQGEPGIEATTLLRSLPAAVSVPATSFSHRSCALGTPASRHRFRACQRDRRRGADLPRVAWVPRSQHGAESGSERRGGQRRGRSRRVGLSASGVAPSDAVRMTARAGRMAERQPEACPRVAAEADALDGPPPESLTQAELQDDGGSRRGGPDTGVHDDAPTVSAGVRDHRPVEDDQLTRRARLIASDGADAHGGPWRERRAEAPIGRRWSSWLRSCRRPRSTPGCRAAGRRGR